MDVDGLGEFRDWEVYDGDGEGVEGDEGDEDDGNDRGGEGDDVGEAGCADSALKGG